MKKAWMIAAVPGIVAGVLAVMAGIFILTLFIVKFLWAWTVPDLFPGAVKQGLIAQDISWYAAAKMAIVVAVIAGVIRGDNCKGK